MAQIHVRSVLCSDLLKEIVAALDEGSYRDTCVAAWNDLNGYGNIVLNLEIKDNTNLAYWVGQVMVAIGTYSAVTITCD